MSELRDRIIEAHGGAAGWDRIRQIMARVSMGGMEFTSRFHPTPLRDVEVIAHAASPMVSFSPFPAAQQTGFFLPSRVWVEQPDGGLHAERAAPGATFRSFKHWFWWDHLDLLYYCGLTLWQALMLPFTLLRSGCELEELASLETSEGRLRRLRVVLPADVPGFAPEQIFHADASGLVRRVEYAPQLYGSWVRVVQVLEGYEPCSGLMCSTRRRIHPVIAGGSVLESVPLGWMHLDDLGVTRDEAE
ncbi:MAG: hypothetical protein JJU06_21825 [Ectothiorhodospiraceae bacterium]|nr:hypothetical protein [Ectothiorhodospiraceae bacterium]